jgi:predicted DNA-binding antitoxin AbrB/MazE fold protein
VTLRENAERPETVDVGANVLVEICDLEMLGAARQMLSQGDAWTKPFGDGKGKQFNLDLLKILSGANMEEIKVVYEKGIFKPLGDIDLKDGTKAVVVLRPKGIADILEKFSRKVDRDVLKEFLEERR